VRGNFRNEIRVSNDPPLPTLPRAGGREKPAALNHRCTIGHTAYHNSFHAMKSLLSILILLLGSLLCDAAGDLTQAEAYRRGYEIEQSGGDPVAALELYAAVAAGADRSLRFRARYRTGFCQRLLGRDDEARITWESLRNEPDLPTDLSGALTGLLAGLMRDRNLRTCRGQVLDPRGQAVSGATVWMGDWSVDPPVTTGTGGLFQATRRYSGWDGAGNPYLLLFARDDQGRLAGVGRVDGPAVAGEKPYLLRLSFIRRLTGRVETGAGHPLAGARIIRETFVPVLQNSRDKKGNVPIPIYLPLDRLSPDPVTDGGGEYELEEVAGTRLKIRAEHPAFPRVVFPEIEPDQQGQRLPILRPIADPGARRVSIGRWIRGERTDAEIGLDDLKGHWVVLHFGSAYAAAEIRRQGGSDWTLLDYLHGVFAARGVEFVWILPSDEDRADVWGLIPEGVDYRVGVDREGVTRAAYPEAAVRGNCILDPTGRVRVEGCRDSELWWWLNRLIQGEGGGERTVGGNGRGF
jgi:hypothetical protein